MRRSSLTISRAKAPIRQPAARQAAPTGRYARRAPFSLGIAVIAAAGVGLSGAAFGQTALEDSVAQRPRPDYEPLGIPVGPAASFNLFPSLTVATEYTDNLFRTEENAVSDEIVQVSPGFSLRSDWLRHAMTLGATATVARHAEHSSENWTDFNAYASGRLDIGDGGQATATVAFRRDHEARGSPDDQNQTEPTVLYVGSLDIAGAYALDALAFRGAFSARRRDFRDAGAINNDDRDRNEYALRGRAAYEWVPGSSAFVEGAIDIRDFDERFDDNGFERSSDGYEILLGGSFDISGVTFAEIAVGYRRQNFDDSRLKPAAGVSFSGRLVWNPTDLLSVDASIRRLVRETTVSGASSAFASVFKLGADYELRDNLLLNAALAYETEDFKGIDRTDDMLAFDLGARYMIGSLVSVDAGWAYEDRGSDAPGESYSANTLRLSASLRF